MGRPRAGVAAASRPLRHRGAANQLAELLQELQVVGGDPHFGNSAGVDAVEGELLGADGAATRRHAEESVAMGSRVQEVRGNPRRVNHEVAYLPAIVGKRADD